MHDVHDSLCVCVGLLVCVRVCVYVLFVLVARQTLYDLSARLSDRFGVLISRSWVCRMYKRWRWSFKNVSRQHTNKFEWNNIRMYGHFLVHVRNIQQTRIKYCDEASFSSRSECNQACACAAVSGAPTASDVFIISVVVSLLSVSCVQNSHVVVVLVLKGP